ncbi:MAG TPA: damage-inducible protein CinA [Rhodobacteraceae bacterium]|nr:damage-inducible protein CinA [Paracoccaceae bacterium]
MRPLAESVLAASRSRGLKIACAESCTGGMVAAALTGIAGSSDVFDRGFVTYSNAAKREMLGVSGQSLKVHGAVSEQVAIEMANGALAHSNANLAVATTGIAGPGPSDHKPEGRVCFAIAGAGQDCQAETVEFGPIGRGKVRDAATRHALNLLKQRACS